jgi:hypothetical protein
MKRRGVRLRQHPRRIGNLPHALDAITIFDRRQQAVIRHDEVLPAFRLRDDRVALRAHARVDDADEDGVGGVVERRARQEARAIRDRIRPDLVREIDDARIRRDAQHHAFADGDGVVECAEIRHEHDGRHGLGSRRFRRAHI